MKNGSKLLCSQEHGRILANRGVTEKSQQESPRNLPSEGEACGSKVWVVVSLVGKWVHWPEQGLLKT